MSNSFKCGISLSDGMTGAPSMSFISDKTSGIYLNNTDFTKVGISVEGDPVVLFANGQVEFLKNIKMNLGAKNQSILVSDENGIASWKVASASGYFKWNSIYTGLNFTQSKYIKNIIFPQQFANVPSVVISKEVNGPLPTEFDIYTRDKSTTGFTINSNMNMFSSIIKDNIDTYATTRLYMGGVATFYKSKTTEKLYYISTDVAYNKIMYREPLLIDNFKAVGPISIGLFGVFPAVVYVVFNTDTNKYEWRFKMANDMSGITFRNPTVFYTTDTNIVDRSLDLFLLPVLDKPTIFMNTENRVVKVFISNNQGVSFNLSFNVGDLNNHKIDSVQIINGFPTILAHGYDNNVIYYVQSNAVDGSAWSPSTIKVVKPNGDNLIVSQNKKSTTMGLINGVLTIIVSELYTNILYSSTANDINGNTFKPAVILQLSNVNATYVTLIQSNDITYLLYNDIVDSVQKKNLVQFAADSSTVETVGFINTLPVGDNQVICIDKDVLIVMRSDTDLILTRFFGNDFNINWVAIA